MVDRAPVFLFGEISDRGRRMRLLDGVPPEHRGVAAIVRCEVRPDPPRCCADLQRMTAERSCSDGFTAPPASFRRPPKRGLGPWRVPLDRRPVGYPSGWSSARGLALTLEDHVRPPVRGSGRAGEACPSLQTTSREVPSPLRRSQPGESTSRSCAPGPSLAVGPDSPMNTTLPGHDRPVRDVGAGPRRGVPRPLRSASVVSHDLDGLLLPEPCDVFRSHTSVGL